MNEKTQKLIDRVKRRYPISKNPAIGMPQEWEDALELCRLLSNAEEELNDIRIELSCPETIECAQKNEPLYKWAALIGSIKIQQAEQINAMKSLLQEFVDSPQYRHIPNWAVIKCQKTLKDIKKAPAASERG